MRTIQFNQIKGNCQVEIKKIPIVAAIGTRLKTKEGNKQYRLKKGKSQVEKEEFYKPITIVNGNKLNMKYQRKITHYNRLKNLAMDICWKCDNNFAHCGYPCEKVKEYWSKCGVAV